MKQSDIKAGRYYQGRRSKVVRFVVEIKTDDYGVPYLYYSLPDFGWQLDVDLKSFARWAGQEVVPSFVPVRRCAKCDSILTWDEDSGLSRLSLCKKCGYVFTISG